VILKRIFLCTLLSLNFGLNSYADSIEVINRGVLKKEIAEHLVNNEKTQAYSKYKKLAFTGDADSMVGLAHLANDETFELYNHETAYHYYVSAVKKGAMAAYMPLIEILINQESAFYNLDKASMYANSYFLKKGKGSQALLSYVLWLMKSDKLTQINVLANGGYQEKERYSVLILGHIYEEGIGASINYSASIEYFNKAAKLGFDVKSDIERVTIKKLSPKIGNLQLYGAQRESVDDVLMKKPVKKVDQKQANIDLYAFDINSNNIKSITTAYSSAQELKAIKYVFDNDPGRFVTLQSVIQQNFGFPSKSKDKFTWSDPLVNVELTQHQQCMSDCMKINKELKTFVTLQYSFNTIGLNDPAQEEHNASSFKF
jgi:hypothetical protein